MFCKVRQTFNKVDKKEEEMEGQWGWGNRGKARRKPHHILCSSFGREDKWVVVLKIPVPHPEAPADPWVTLWS